MIKRHLPSRFKPEAEKTASKADLAKKIEAELKRRVVGTGTPEEQKRKAEWFKSHVIIDMGK